MPRLIEFKDRDEWLASRSQEPWPIGASDAAKIACGKLCEVWVEKKLKQQLDKASMPFLELGHCLEAGILEAGRRILGLEIEAFDQTATWAHDEIDWARCTPDAVWCGMGIPLPTINAKNVSWNNPRFNDYRNGLIPDDHLFGAHWEMFVSGASRALILALVGGSEVVPFHVDRDDDVIRGMFDACSEFRERYLIGDEEPEPDASPVTARAFSQRAAYEPESEVFLSDVSEAAAEADWRLVQVEPQLKSLEEEKELCRNRIRQVMGTVQRAVAPSGRVYSWTKNGHLKVKT